LGADIIGAMLMGQSTYPPAAFRAALEAIGGVLDRAGLTWWIQDGTLLGAVRNGGPIPGDRDIDIGIHATAFRPSLVDDLLAAGFVLRRSRGLTDAGPLKVAVSWHGVAIDIFGMYARDDHWHYVVKHRGIEIENRFRPFGIGRIGFLGLQVPCPDPAEDFLVAEYGPDWRVPTSDWHYAFSPHNLHLTGGRGERLAYGLAYLRWRWKTMSRRFLRPAPIEAPITEPTSCTAASMPTSSGTFSTSAMPASSSRPTRSASG
jgi:hypothetical protein